MKRLSVCCRITALFGLLYVFVLPSLSSFGQSEYGYDYGYGNVNGYGYSSPIVRVLDTVTLDAENRQLEFTVLLSEPQNHPVSCDSAAAIALDDSMLDYPYAPTHVTFQPGEVAQAVRVDIELDEYDTDNLESESIFIGFGVSECIGAFIDMDDQFGVGIIPAS